LVSGAGRYETVQGIFGFCAHIYGACPPCERDRQGVPEAGCDSGGTSSDGPAKVPFLFGRGQPALCTMGGSGGGAAPGVPGTHFPAGYCPPSGPSVQCEGEGVPRGSL